MTMNGSETSSSNFRDALAMRRETFRALHEGGCFVIPNPWNVGSAVTSSASGSSAGHDQRWVRVSQGLPDSEAAVAREQSLAHLRDCRAVDVPVSADYGSAYGIQPPEVADSVKRCVATGVAGLSIEDATGDPAAPLYALSFAVRRVRAARRAIDESGGGVLLTARAECYHVGHSDPLRESVRRLQAYAEAGADVLFAPGPRRPKKSKRWWTPFGQTLQPAGGSRSGIRGGPKSPRLASGASVSVVH